MLSDVHVLEQHLGSGLILLCNCNCMLTPVSINIATYRIINGGCFSVNTNISSSLKIFIIREVKEIK